MIDSRDRCLQIHWLPGLQGQNCSKSFILLQSWKAFWVVHCFEWTWLLISPTKGIQPWVDDGVSVGQLCVLSIPLETMVASLKGQPRWTINHFVWCPKGSKSCPFHTSNWREICCFFPPKIKSCKGHPSMFGKSPSKRRKGPIAW